MPCTFPSTPGSLIRATACDDSHPAVYMLAAPDDDCATPSWVRPDLLADPYRQADLTLLDVLHDEGRAEPAVDPAKPVVWWGTIGDIPADAQPSDEEIAVAYVAQAAAYLQPWEKALREFTAAPDSPARRAALRAAHDRYFTTATTAFAAAAMAKGWKPADVRTALEMGDAWEHLHEWLWPAMGFEENAEMDDLLARLVCERPSDDAPEPDHPEEP